MAIGKIIALLFKLEIGMASAGFTTYIPYQETQKIENLFFVSLDTTVKIIDFIYVGGFIKIPFYVEDVSTYQGIPSCNPVDLLYGFRAYLRFGGLSLGMRHLCCHPAFEYLNWGTLSETLGSRTAEGSTTEFFISFEGEIPIL